MGTCVCCNKIEGNGTSFQMAVYGIILSQPEFVRTLASSRPSDKVQ